MVYFDVPLNHLHINDAYFRIIEDYREKPELDWHVKSIRRKDGIWNVLPVYYEAKNKRFVSIGRALEILENQLRRLEELL